MSELFDLNIEQVLEDWEIEHALREIIANALDEQTLTKTSPIEIYNTGTEWHIRDYGRGLRYRHFTQNENREKLFSPNLIGKFGVGLKDALAVFFRKGVKVEIDSRFAHITLRMANKTGFDVSTLHAVFSDPLDTQMKGTDFTFIGIDEEAVERAKALFLCFNKEAVLLEKNKYGEVYKNRRKGDASIYINGVKVASEDNFLFSYNITNLSYKIKQALNRERSNVGRAAYSDTVKSILKSCVSIKVLLPLMEDLQNVMKGKNCDESAWLDVAAYAAKTLNDADDVVFMTPSKRDSLSNQDKEILQESGKRLIMVTDKVYSKINSSVVTFDDVYKKHIEEYKYEYVEYNDLTLDERKVFDTKQYVIEFLKKYNYKYDANIRVSETIRPDYNAGEADGVWSERENAIIIRRCVLSNIKRFLGVLIHEFAHYTSGEPDNCRAFENVLTDMLGEALFEANINKM